MNVQWEKRPSIGLGWLARRERQLPTPHIVHVEGLTMSGYYVNPSRRLQVVEGVEITPSHGTIVVGVHESPYFSVESTIAHEWRHHWQQWEGWRYDGVGWDESTDHDGWDAAITRYFSESYSEFDALRYEITVAPADHTLWLASLVTEPV